MGHSCRRHPHRSGRRRVSCRGSLTAVPERRSLKLPGGRGKQHWHGFILGVLPLVLPRDAHAHDFGAGSDTYGVFLSGCTAVLAELPVMIALLSTGILVSLWDREGLPKVWPGFLAGVAGGMLLALADVVDPVGIAYGAAMALGLLAVAAVKPGIPLMLGILFIAGLLPIAALLAGHEIGTVPVAAYAGILATANFVLAASAGITAIMLERLPYGWVSVAFRALASWMVAIALISFTFLMRESP